MDKREQYRRATLASLSQEQIKQALDNQVYGSKRFPKEHAEAMANIKARGLENHREVLQYYARNKMPMHDDLLKQIQAFAGSTYAGPFGKGEQREEATTTSGGTPLDALYRQSIKPGGSE